MPSSLTALGLAIVLTFSGSSLASSPPDGDADAPATVEDANSDGAYLVATMALLGLAGLAGVTRRDYVRAHRHTHRRGQPVEAPSSSNVEPPPASQTRCSPQPHAVRQRPGRRQRHTERSDLSAATDTR